MLVTSEKAQLTTGNHVLDNRPMLRDSNLVPLSRQHQHALALCVRINRAGLSTAAELAAWQAEIQQHVELEIQYHFAAEESYIFPVALRFAELRPLIEELLKEHAELRSYFLQASKRSLDREGLLRFAELLTGHIRKEERRLFEAMQEKMNAEELAQIGANVDRALEAASEACITPTETLLKRHIET